MALRSESETGDSSYAMTRGGRGMREDFERRFLRALQSENDTHAVLLSVQKKNDEVDRELRDRSSSAQSSNEVMRGAA